MAKIIAITENIISIGTDDGKIKEVRPSDINFLPEVGDEVEIFETELKTIVSKVNSKSNTSTPVGGININVENNNTPSATYIANGTKAVNKIAYCLLALFLGGIGVHKFYAGKIGTGVLFILFSWTFIPAIIGLIDFIVGLCKPADSNGTILV